MPRCQRIPQKRRVELVAKSETGNTGLHALSRSLCHELCLVRDCSAPAGRIFWRHHWAAVAFYAIQPGNRSGSRGPHGSTERLS